MKKMIIVMLGVLLGFNIQAQEGGWEQKEDKEGIKLYTKKTEGLKYKSVKTDALVNTTMDEAVEFIKKVDNYPQWIYKCKSAKIINQPDENTIVHYQVNQVPVAKDRDMVIQLTFSKDNDGTMIIKQEAKEGVMEDQEDLVRIKSMTGEWMLKPENDKLRVIYTLALDPGGDVPAWIVNKGISEGPFQTALNMKKALEAGKQEQPVDQKDAESR